MHPLELTLLSIWDPDAFLQELASAAKAVPLWAGVLWPQEGPNLCWVCEQQPAALTLVMALSKPHHDF